MNKQQIILLTVIAVAAIGIGLFYWTTSNKNAAMEKDKMENDSMMKDDSAMEGGEAGDAMIKDEKSEDSMMQDDSKSGSYLDYSAANLASATAKGKAVLFFHAKWCPTCKAANEAFLQNSDKIPPGVTILKTDYDTQTELKQKYSITYQHTFVQVDANGTELAKWNGGDIAELAANIK